MVMTMWKNSLVALLALSNRMSMLPASVAVSLGINGGITFGALHPFDIFCFFLLEGFHMRILNIFF